MVDGVDLTDMSDDDLRDLGDQVAAERNRRYVLAQGVAQGTALAIEFAEAGGDVASAWAQILANVQAAQAPADLAPSDPTTDQTVTG